MIYDKPAKEKGEDQVNHSASRSILSGPELPARSSDNFVNKPSWDFRRLMAWMFLLSALGSTQQTIRLLITQHSAFPTSGYRGILGGPVFSAVIAIICAVAWWKIWKKARWGRGWGIAASLTFVATFMRPFVIPLGPAWHHMGDLWIAVVGLAVFLRPASRPTRTQHLDD